MSVFFSSTRILPPEITQDGPVKKYLNSFQNLVLNLSRISHMVLVSSN